MLKSEKQTHISKILSVNMLIQKRIEYFADISYPIL